MCTNGVEKRLESGPNGARGTNVDVGSYVGRMSHYVGSYDHPEEAGRGITAYGDTCGDSTVTGNAGGGSGI